MAAELEALVSNDNQIRLELIKKDLQESGSLHALAILYSHNNCEEDALRTWQVVFTP
jgi:hypothetical protein